MPNGFWEYQRVLLAVWFAGSHDEQDSHQNPAFEQMLQRAYSLYYVTLDKVAALQHIRLIEVAINTGTVRDISWRQQVRYGYLYGHIAFGNHEIFKAVDNLQFTLSVLTEREQDWEGLIEVKHWLAIAYLQSHEHRTAIDLFNEILKDLTTSPPLNFLIGDAPGFLVEMHTLRSIALMARAMFEESLEDVAWCHDHVQWWLSRGIGQNGWQVRDMLAQQLHDHPTAVVTMSLAPFFVGSSLNATESAMVQLLELHCKNIWQKALVLYWRERASPTPSDLRGYANLEEGFNLLGAAIALSKRFPALTVMMPHMYRARADIALQLSDYQWRTPAKRGSASQWLKEVRIALDQAISYDHLLPEGGRYAESPEIGQLSDASYRTLLYADVQRDSIALMNLRHEVEELCQVFEQKKAFSLMGRALIILGEISDALGQLSLTDAKQEFAQAKEYYQRALLIFLTADNALRIGEVQRLLSEIPL